VELDLLRNRYSLIGSEHGDAPLVPPPPPTLREVVQVGYPLVPPLAALARFAVSARRAARLRKKPIREQLRFCRAATNVGDVQPDGTAVEGHVRVYRYLRALRYRQVPCLEDSVCGYLYFNSIPGVRAEIVFGVSTVPTFQAHAWLESCGFLLNDIRARVESYSEILRVGPLR
jgi:hypothetical protein